MTSISRYDPDMKDLENGNTWWVIQMDKIGAAKGRASGISVWFNHVRSLSPGLSTPWHLGTVR